MINIDKFAVKDHQNLQQLHWIKTTQHMIFHQVKTDKHDNGKTAALVFISSRLVKDCVKMFRSETIVGNSVVSDGIQLQNHHCYQLIHSTSIYV